MKDINWVDTYSSGEIAFVKAYLLINNVPPLKYIRRLGSKKIDLTNIDISTIKKQYPNATLQYMHMVVDEDADPEENITIEDSAGNTSDVYAHGKWHSFDINIYDNDVFYLIDSSSVTILYKDGIDVEKLYNELINILPRKEDVPQSREIDLVAYNQGEYYTITSEVNPIEIDIEENYSDDFLPVYKDIVDFLNRRESGIIICRGEVGTGKTSLIRHLITTVPKHYVFITNGIAEHLGSPEFTSFLLENKDSVFILEDCEQILRKRTDTNFFGSGIANILNMSDGLLSDIFNIKFICTFNADMNMIDEALLRKGRCFANYEFKPLDSIKTQKLLHKRGFDVENPKPLTLAEIYNFSSKDYSNKPKRKIGF